MPEVTQEEAELYSVKSFMAHLLYRKFCLLNMKPKHPSVFMRAKFQVNVFNCSISPYFVHF